MYNSQWLSCVVLAVTLASAHPTIYKMNDEEILSPVLVPVSSTVIPLPIYKVSTSLTRDSHDESSFGEGSLPSPKLITVKSNKKKLHQMGASVKAVAKNDWEAKAL